MVKDARRLVRVLLVRRAAQVSAGVWKAFKPAFWLIDVLSTCSANLFGSDIGGDCLCKYMVLPSMSVRICFLSLIIAGI